MSAPAIEGTNALVTGGAGFIGSHLVDALLVKGAAKVSVVDNFFLGKEPNLAAAEAAHGGKLAIYREDAADPGAMATIVDRERPDVVYNLATKALLYSFFNPAGAYRVNVDIALTLCELLRHHAFGRLVHVSSSEVYGTARRVPMDESHPMFAETTYAAGKAAADLAVGAYTSMYDLDTVTVRPFNNFGPRQNDGEHAAIVPTTISRILAGQPPIIAGDGAQTRDFTYVADTVDAITRLAELKGVRGEVFNVGSGVEVSIDTVVRTIASLMNYSGEFISAPARTADVRRHLASVHRAQALIGPVSTVPLDHGLAQTIKWHRNGPSS